VVSSTPLPSNPREKLTFGFSTKILYAYLISLMRATRPAHFSFDFIALIKFGKEIMKLLMMHISPASCPFL
jgi:hypothetical protein